SLTTIPGVWQDNNPGGSNAVWVSFNANHGSIGPNVQAPDAATGNQTVTFNYSFSLATPAQISFQVWADDTAEVLLDGVSQIAGNGTQGENCAAGAIGCTDLNFGVVSALLAAGNHDIDFAVYQRVVSAQGVGTPFGLLFAGELTPVPEPASILLLGSALTAVGMVSKRRWFSKKD
ncbi:MAG TPA: PEP-CTERM sorting domain-containing protein, partial [Methylomirabilota bacterium]